MEHSSPHFHFQSFHLISLFPWLKRGVCRLATMALLFATVLPALSDPTVLNVVAKQRYPWNGKVDITCTVSGIDETTKRQEFAVAVVDPDSGDARKVSHFQVKRGSVYPDDNEVTTNGNYRLLWDAHADLGEVNYSNMVVRVTIVKGHGRVQLWEGGPYWAETNIGAEEPEEYGLYFWWGDTIGYRCENDAWVASDGSSQNLQSDDDPICRQTFEKSRSALRNGGWTTAKGVLAPEHDAAHVHWGGKWRTPTLPELSALVSNCDWTWTTQNGVYGYIGRGRGDYASASIFLPAAAYTYWDGTPGYAGWSGSYMSSGPVSDDGIFYHVDGLGFSGSRVSPCADWGGYRFIGRPVRPVQGFSE